MPLPYDMTPVLDEFLTAVVCFDETSTMENFELKPVVGPEYVIAGVLIPPTDLDLQLFDEGEIRDGAMTLYTYSTVTLHFHDWGSVDGEQRQTFVKFNGDIYRIKGLSPRGHDGLHKKWTMVRYVERKSNN